MILVFLPALILKTFTTYFTIKMFTLKLPVEFWIVLDFLLWNLFLVVPVTVAVCIGARTVGRWRRLCSHMGRYSNLCSDDGTLLKVSLLETSTRWQIDLLSVERFESEAAQSCGGVDVRILQHRLAAWAVDDCLYNHLHDHYLPVWV